MLYPPLSKMLSMTKLIAKDYRFKKYITYFDDSMKD